MNTPAQHDTSRQVLTRVESALRDTYIEYCMTCRGAGAHQVCMPLGQACPVCNGQGYVIIKKPEPCPTSFQI